MGYTSEQIKGKLQKGKRTDVIQRALLHQNRIRFHVEKKVTAWDARSVANGITQPLSQFLAMVENILPHDKFVTFKTLFRYPVKTNEITGVCFDKLARIFDGRNPVYNYLFTTPEYRDDWDEYRRYRLREPEVWSSKGWEYFKTEINSVLICDLPVEQVGELPEPYFYWLPIKDVLTFEANPETGVMRFIAFRSGDNVVVIDDESYRVWEDPKHTGMIDGEPFLFRPHDLGYTPARFFWNESISIEEPDIKESPLTKELESLDWYLFFHISKRQLDLMGAYPILSGYEQSCDFSNAENGDYCDGGFLKDKQGRYKMDLSGLLMRCPKCGHKRIIGPGSFVEIPVPNSEENQPDLRNPVQMLEVDKDSLEYNVDEEIRLRTSIIESVVGQDFIITNREAFNEQQVRANFESQANVLNHVKKGFEAAQKWVDETICRLRYGAYFVAAEVNYGTEFYLSSLTELRDTYKTAKEAGASDAELDAISDQIIETEYRHNPALMRKMLILSDLEPYRHLSREQVLNLYEKKLISERDLQVKMNFTTFVKRFERENMNVVEFGSAIPYEEKIDNINQVLGRYAEELTKTLTAK